MPLARVAGLILSMSLFSGSLAAQEKNPFQLLSMPVPDGAIRLTYGTDSLHFGELRVPATAGPHPVAILVHGGCWLAQLGDADRRLVALDLVRPAAAALTDAGIATWNVEYRRVGNPGGGWPNTFLDVADAADFLRSVAAQHGLDLGRVVAIGHSSGGHLAMWLAARARLPGNSELYRSDPLKLVGVLNLDGPADLESVVPLQERICGTPVVTDLMGGPPAERRERYRDASPTELLPLGVSQELLAGRMFGTLAASYAERATRAGDRVQVAVDSTAGHFLFLDPESHAWPRVLERVQALLK